jgi:hypothetical protein
MVTADMHRSKSMQASATTADSSQEAYLQILPNHTAVM